MALEYWRTNLSGVVIDLPGEMTYENAVRPGQVARAAQEAGDVG